MLAGIASTAGRAAIYAVRVQIIPAPRSLADSREILRILQGYGEVSTYRWLKHDDLSSAPNSALAIFSHAESMNKLLLDCPLTFEIDRTEREEAVFDELSDEGPKASESLIETSSSPSGDNELTRTDNVLADWSPRAATEGKAAPNRPTYHSRPQLFRVNADIWRGKHRDWLERHPFWGNFQPNRKSIVQQDLGKRVPLIGLSDIDANGKSEIPIRILERRKQDLAKRPTLRDMIRDMRGRDGGQSGAEENGTGHWG